MPFGVSRSSLMWCAPRHPPIQPDQQGAAGHARSVSNRCSRASDPCQAAVAKEPRAPLSYRNIEWRNDLNVTCRHRIDLRHQPVPGRDRAPDLGPSRGEGRFSALADGCCDQFRADPRSAISPRRSAGLKRQLIIARYWRTYGPRADRQFGPRPSVWAAPDRLFPGKHLGFIRWSCSGPAFGLVISGREPRAAFASPFRSRRRTRRR